MNSGSKTTPKIIGFLSRGTWGVVDCDRWVAVELAGPGGKEGNGGLFGCDGQFVFQGPVMDWGEKV